MPYCQPVKIPPTAEIRNLTAQAIRALAREGMHHLDMEWRHVALWPPQVADSQKDKQHIIFFDLGMFKADIVEETEKKNAETDMLSRLELLDE